MDLNNDTPAKKQAQNILSQEILETIWSNIQQNVSPTSKKYKPLGKKGHEH